ncbi:hypothetical protein FBD94_20500 [Pedobacter hiemivivus]|jgi:hypothetical protein|uniref:ABM domain-containing protein n=1 Tax=Pedobacter hiemivivus TaxID=2530454 RepID=A0A4R0NA00_9SPHI|nr:hypothetical protein [Pedobacter hiemivivus]TCC96915.1 hypothetical protein EZ444_08585 [Pedobacter hiemivivus]TKC57658.1 hypothetical protein FBD94_20500 [Pedobacter hiemivivus]
MEKVMVYFDMPGVSGEQYDQVWRDLRESGNPTPKGLLHHAAAPTPNSWLVVDVWESEDDFKEFGKTLMPILEKNGFPKGDPVILPLHNMYVSSALHEYESKI